MHKVRSLLAVVVLLGLGGTGRGEDPLVPRGIPGPGANLGQNFADFGKLNTPPVNSPFGRGRCIAVAPARVKEIGLRRPGRQD